MMINATATATPRLAGPPADRRKLGSERESRERENVSGRTRAAIPPPRDHGSLALMAFVPRLAVTIRHHCVDLPPS
jgi:hypothetical protein